MNYVTYVNKQETGRFIMSFTCATCPSWACVLANVMSCPACISQHMVTSCIRALANIRWSHLVYVHWPTYGPVLCALANVLSWHACTSQHMVMFCVFALANIKVTSCMCALTNIESHTVYALTNIMSCFSVWTDQHMVMSSVCTSKHMVLFLCVQANIWSCFCVCMSQHTVLFWMCTSQQSHCVITVTVIAKWQVLCHPSLVTDCRLYQCSSVICLQSMPHRKISPTVS